MINGPRYIFYKKTMSKLPYGEVRRVHVALEAAPVHVAIAVEVAVDNTVELAKRVQRGGIAVPEAPIPSKHRHSTVTAPSKHRHSTVTAPSKHRHITVTARIARCTKRNTSNTTAQHGATQSRSRATCGAMATRCVRAARWPRCVRRDGHGVSKEARIPTLYP